MKRLALLLACSLASFTASADDAPSFYLQAGIGHVSLNHGSLSLTPSFGGSVDGTGTAWSVTGGYSVNQYFAVEFGYHDYGKPTAFLQSGTTVQTCPQDFACPHFTGYTLEAVGRYEFVPGVFFEPVAGTLLWQASGSGNVLGKNSGSELIFGLRVRHPLDDHWSVGVAYEHSGFTTEESRLELRYTF